MFIPWLLSKWFFSWYFTSGPQKKCTIKSFNLIQIWKHTGLESSLISYPSWWPCCCWPRIWRGRGSPPRCSRASRWPRPWRWRAPPRGWPPGRPSPPAASSGTRRAAPRYWRCRDTPRSPAWSHWSGWSTAGPSPRPSNGLQYNVQHLENWRTFILGTSFNYSTYWK